MMNPVDNKRAFLVHWIYNKEEWQWFMRWRSKRSGWWNYFLFTLIQRKRQAVPEIAITEYKVWIGDVVHCFRDNDKQLKRVSIRETGKLHVMEIGFEQREGKQISYGHIYIPVPVGKLREAMQVHESLSAHAW